MQLQGGPSLAVLLRTCLEPLSLWHRLCPVAPCRPVLRVPTCSEIPSWQRGLGCAGSLALLIPPPRGKILQEKRRPNHAKWIQLPEQISRACTRPVHRYSFTFQVTSIYMPLERNLQGCLLGGHAPDFRFIRSVCTTSCFLFPLHMQPYFVFTTWHSRGLLLEPLALPSAVCTAPHVVLCTHGGLCMLFAFTCLEQPGAWRGWKHPPNQLGGNGWNWALP